MKIFYWLLAVNLMIGCHSPKTETDTIRERTEAYLKAHDQTGSGYEFVAITDIDTVTGTEFLERQMDVLKLALVNKDTRIHRMDSIRNITEATLRKNPNDQVAAINLNDISKSIANLEHQQHMLDSLAAMAGPDLDHLIRFIGLNFEFKSRNTADVKMSHHYYFKLDQNLNVISASEL